MTLWREFPARSANAAHRPRRVPGGPFGHPHRAEPVESVRGVRRHRDPDQCQRESGRGKPAIGRGAGFRAALVIFKPLAPASK